jgi:DNA-binding SARP family transcriptional activator
MSRREAVRGPSFQQHPEDTLRIRLLSTLELHLNEQALPAFATRTAKSVFCFLVMNRRRMFPRLVLLGQFWGERDEAGARRNLRTVLWRIRGVLEPAGVTAGSFLRVEDDCIGFDPRVPYWLDVEAFEQGVLEVERCITRGEPVSTRMLEQVLGFYRGDLLDDLYDDWCTFERERLRLAFLTLLERLAQHQAERNDWAAALSAGRTLLHHDPLREHMHRLVMRCHWRAGNRPAALLQYDACARLLRAELDIGPMPETTALRDAVLRDESVPPEPPSMQRKAERWSNNNVLRDLDAAAAHLDHARARIAHELSQDALPPQ